MTDWKQFEEMPDEGLFDKIQHRLRVRRAWRVGGSFAVAVAVVAVVTLGVVFAIQPRSAAEVAATENQVVVNMETPANVISQQADNQSSVGVLSVPTPYQQRTLSEPSPAPLASQTAVVGGSYDSVPVQNTLRPMTQPEAHGEAEQGNTQSVDAAPQVIRRIEPSVMDDAEVAAPDVAAPQKTSPPEPEPYHEDNLYWAPNIILPNGEREENRVFGIAFSSEVTEFNLHIYNRGGRLVYNTNDPAFVWDATLNGAALPQGAYVWVATFRDSSGSAQRASGTVTVVR